MHNFEFILDDFCKSSLENEEDFLKKFSLRKYTVPKKKLQFRYTDSDVEKVHAAASSVDDVVKDNSKRDHSERRRTERIEYKDLSKVLMPNVPWWLLVKGVEENVTSQCLVTLVEESVQDIHVLNSRLAAGVDKKHKPSKSHTRIGNITNAAFELIDSSMVVEKLLKDQSEINLSSDGSDTDNISVTERAWIRQCIGKVQRLLHNLDSLRLKSGCEKCKGKKNLDHKEAELPTGLCACDLDRVDQEVVTLSGYLYKMTQKRGAKVDFYDYLSIICRLKDIRKSICECKRKLLGCSNDTLACNSEELQKIDYFEKPEKNKTHRKLLKSKQRLKNNEQCKTSKTSMCFGLKQDSSSDTLYDYKRSKSNQHEARKNGKAKMDNNKGNCSSNKKTEAEMWFCSRDTPWFMQCNKPQENLKKPTVLDTTREKNGNEKSNVCNCCDSLAHKHNNSPGKSSHSASGGRHVTIQQECSVKHEEQQFCTDVKKERYTANYNESQNQPIAQGICPENRSICSCMKDDDQREKFKIEKELVAKAIESKSCKSCKCPKIVDSSNLPNQSANEDVIRCKCVENDCSSSRSKSCSNEFIDRSSNRSNKFSMDETLRWKNTETDRSSNRSNKSSNENAQTDCSSNRSKKSSNDILCCKHANTDRNSNRSTKSSYDNVLCCKREETDYSSARSKKSSHEDILSCKDAKIDRSSNRCKNSFNDDILCCERLKTDCSLNQSKKPSTEDDLCCKYVETSCGFNELKTPPNEDILCCTREEKDFSSNGPKKIQKQSIPCCKYEKNDDELDRLKQSSNENSSSHWKKSLNDGTLCDKNGEAESTTLWKCVTMSARSDCANQIPTTTKLVACSKNAQRNGEKFQQQQTKEPTCSFPQDTNMDDHTFLASESRDCLCSNEQPVQIIYCNLADEIKKITAGQKKGNVFLQFTCVYEDLLHIQMCTLDNIFLGCLYATEAATREARECKGFDGFITISVTDACNNPCQIHNLVDHAFLVVHDFNNC